MYKRTVLVVDDQEVNRKILGKILREEYEVLFAENGKVALECLRKHSNQISAVLLDIVMPEMNGYQVLEAMKSDASLSMIPVIVSSQKDGDEAEIHALSLGAQDFIAKPYKQDIIRHRLSNLIRLRETSSTINRIQKDQLTGLYNKEYFISKTEELLRENRDKQYDILYIGIERFKLVNDAYGTMKGNEVLQYLAGILLDLSVGKAMTGRFGADNFYLLLEHRAYTNEMFEPLFERMSHCPIDLDIKLHCGIYEITDASMEAGSMCDRAKMAADMNRGKYDQRFSWYDESLREKLLNEQFILSTMHTALEEHQFEVYYQPKYDLMSEMVAGAEALVRWIHPERGFMSPGEFIPVFERNGFVTQLDRYVWETACRDIHNWIEAGYPLVAVSVNVSRADIYNPKLLDILLGMVAKYQIPIRYLHLEVTESAYTDNPSQIIESVRKLRDAGFVIEMDDFGSGYSSLNMLAEMPVDILKLDMRFIQTEATISSGRGILSFIISLAKWMGLAVVAEGVETVEQIAVLRSMDCNYVQGFYYAKPMKKEDFEHVLETANVTEMICTSRTAVQYLVENKPIHSLEDGRVMLIVDDIEVNRASLASAFAEEYVIVEKENGVQAWNYLQEHCQDVEIIMMDLLMPEMDGFQLLSRIRSDKRMKDLPIIITSQGDADSEHRALEMQANDYISKPYNLDIIRHRVANVVGNYQLQCLKNGTMKEEDLKRYRGVDGSVMLSDDERILKNMEILKENFDIVRLVDPTKTIVYEGDECDIQSCYSVWGKTTRCNNCTSMKAFEKRTRVNKLEYSTEGLFFVISQYVPYGKFGAVMEMVTKLSDEYVDNVFDKDMLYLNLNEIHSQLERDDLTGVFNRRHMDMYLNKYIATARREHEDIGIAMVDVDHFKQLNDTEGHMVGDEALKAVSRMLQENIALSKGDFVARFGGDEFIIVCRNIESNIFEKRINTVISLVTHVVSDEGVKMRLSISAGCAMLSEFPDADSRALLKCADRRLYLAKEGGRGCVIAKG